MKKLEQFPQNNWIQFRCLAKSQTQHWLTSHLVSHLIVFASPRENYFFCWQFHSLTTNFLKSVLMSLRKSVVNWLNCHSVSKNKQGFPLGLAIKTIQCNLIIINRPDEPFQSCQSHLSGKANIPSFHLFFIV